VLESLKEHNLMASNSIFLTFLRHIGLKSHSRKTLNVRLHVYIFRAIKLNGSAIFVDLHVLPFLDHRPLGDWVPLAMPI